MTADIDIQIDEMILIGFGAIDRERVRTALAAELARLLAEEGLPKALRGKDAIETIDGGAFRLLPGMQPEQIGRQIAGALYRAFER